MNNILSSIKTFFQKNEGLIKPTVVMIAICAVVTLALSSTNLLTEQKILRLSQENEKRAMQRLLVADDYNNKTLDVDGAQVGYYEAVSDGSAVGYIFVTSAKGYGGDVSVMTAINTDGTINAVEILDAANETPGLGQNVTKSSFYGQYSGLTEKITVVKNGAQSKNNEIKAVTGATISSKAVSAAVNTSLDYASKIVMDSTAKAVVQEGGSK